MRVKKLMKLFSKRYAGKEDALAQLTIFTDGSGSIRNYHTQERIYAFYSIEQLMNFLKNPTRGENRKDTG